MHTGNTVPNPPTAFVTAFLVVLATGVAVARTDAAEGYPAKPIRMIVPFSPGKLNFGSGGSGTLAFVFATVLQEAGVKAN
jgi:tripartite-type tricarboxylate transporter receptor subunit TctC